LPRLSLEVLEKLLADASLSQVVAHPRDLFCDVVSMAIAAALSQKNPAFTMRELEAMLFDSKDDYVVQVEGTEFAALVKLAMQAERGQPGS
jgi:hypothetical protein